MIVHHVKQRKSTQEGGVVFFDIHKNISCPWPFSSQAYKAEKKLQSSHYDGEKKRWDCNEYVTLHKEQNTIMEILADDDYIGMNSSAKFHYFL